MTKPSIPPALLGLQRRIMLLHLVIWSITLLMGALGLLTVAMGLTLDFPPLWLLSLAAVGGAVLTWRMLQPVLERAKARLAESARLLEGVAPREVTLFFNQALVWEGPLCALIDPATSSHLCLLQLSGLDYPRQRSTQVRLYETPELETVLVDTGRHQVDGRKLDMAGLERQKAAFARLMRALQTLVALGFAGLGVETWSGEPRTDALVACGFILLAWILVQLLMSRLLIGRNARRLAAIEAAVLDRSVPPD